jgi:HEPN domain-containing protein
MTDAGTLLAGAREWLDAARAESNAGRLRVAFESARHSAELACKTLLVLHQGEFPKTHLVAPPLVRLGLLPPHVDAKALHKLLAEFTLGTYGFDRPITGSDVQRALSLASAVLAAAEAAASPQG